MAWHQLTIALGAADAARAESLLNLAGAVAVTLGDDRDDPVLEPPPGAVQLWPHVRLTALFEEDVDPESVAALIANALGADGIEVERVEDTDWIAGWQQQVEPVEIGPELRIAPSADAGAWTPESTVLLDMGLAFGTGRHPTTRLCLEWLATRSLGGQTVLDYGCGSGVLALAAIKRGALRAICTDNDEQALLATQGNATLNGLSERVMTCAPESLPAETVGLILANILAGTLQALAPEFAARHAKGGTIVLSGVLTDQTEAVVAAFAPDYADFEIAKLDGWARIVATRR